MQRRGVEGEAEEKQRNQDEDKAKQLQRCTQVDEDREMRWSSQGDKDEEKQWSGKEGKPEEMQRRGDQDEAEHKHPRADEDMECRGLDQPGQNEKERLKRKDQKMRRNESRHPGLEHLGRNKQHGPPPPGLEHLGTGGGQAAPRTGSSEDKRRPNATDWIIQGGSSSTSHRTPSWIIRGQRAAKRPGLEHPGRNRQQEPPHPRHERGGTRGGQTPWTGACGAEQEGAATTTGAAERWFATPGN